MSEPQDIFTDCLWSFDGLTPEDVEFSVGLHDCPARPFALFDISSLFDEYKSVPFPSEWRPEGLRAPFPGTVFRFLWPTESNVECLVALFDTDTAIHAWVVHRWDGTKRVQLVGVASWLEGSEWRVNASDLLVSKYWNEDAVTADNVLDQLVDNRDQANILLQQTMTMVFSALYLLESKNVTTEQVLPSRQARRAAERRGIDIPVEYRIVVKVPGKQPYTIAGPRRSGEAVMPAHMVRGHFSEYSAEKPLFGKYAGRFWIPAHVRGKREEGEETKAKDYVVKSRPA